MKPKTKIEKEVARLSGQLLDITESQKKWALKHCIEGKEIIRLYGKPHIVSHFIIVTVKGDWQVLRHFYVYARFRYKKLYSTNFFEVMQEWYYNGEYVFMSRNRNGLSYRLDSWILTQPMSIKRGAVGGWMGDPRYLSYDGVKYEYRKPQFRYIPKDDKCSFFISSIYRAVNISSFNETLLKQCNDKFLWAVRNGFAFDKEKTAAMKIACRYGYDFTTPEWKDMVDNLAYLKKDLHNPKLVCPLDLHEAHDKWMIAASNKRQKMYAKMGALALIREEKEQLRRMQAEAERVRKEEERTKKAIPYYIEQRKRFFGLVITDGELDIRVLKSVEEFMEEGNEMCHCVFSNGYYDVEKKPYCLILSAKKDGNRIETIEVDMRDYHIVQSRGKYNSQTPYHDKILSLIYSNMELIKRLNKRSRKKESIEMCNLNN